MLLTRVLPLALHQIVHQPQESDVRNALVTYHRRAGQCLIQLNGAWRLSNLQAVREAFTRAVQSDGPVELNLAQVHSIDSAFVGLLLLLEQALSEAGRTLRLSDTPASIRRTLQLSSVQHLVVE